MRIEISTKGKRIADKDLRSLIIMMFGIRIASPRMIKANLEFIVDHFGYRLEKK